MAQDFVLTAITRDPAVVRAVDDAGVDRVGIDIERVGKAARQALFPDARISDHRLDDLATVAAHTSRAAVFVRVNPIHEGSPAEIDATIALGARVVMLPHFSTPEEARCFVELVGGRASPVLLVETAAAAARIRDIAAVPGVDEIMIGHNDLHMSLGLAGPFEVVVSDLMETIATRVRRAGLRFGFGGLARHDDRTLPVPPDLVCAQYARLGATSAWLARSFFRGLDGPAAIPPAVAMLRERLAHWAAQPPSVLEAARDKLAALLRPARADAPP